MDKNFFIGNRERFGKEMPNKSVTIFMAGKDICESLDEAYKFVINRSFIRLVFI